MQLNLVGKHALVTGGSRGIGNRLARALHEEGAEVVIFYNHTDATELAREMTGDGAPVHAVRCNVENREDIARAVEESAALLGGRIDIVINAALLEELSLYCDEFLVHAVDVEGKNHGIEQNLVKTLADYRGIPVTYAGGISSYEDMKVLRKIGNNRINMTVGSALDLFGGRLEFKKIVAEYHDKV